MSGPTIRFHDGAPILDVERRRLPCGLEVVLHREPTALNVAVHVHYRVGSSDEAPGRTGMAHLFEHLFKNSAHLAGQNHYELLREVGGSGNASTGSDATNYHAVVPPDALALALWIESDRMGYLLPGLDEARLAKQIEVVRAERRQRYENVAYGRERFATAEALYPEGHPHRHLTIGTHADIAATTLAELQGWYRTWYVPANAVLAIAGAIELDEAWALVDRYFGSFPASVRPPRAVPGAPRPRATELVVDDQRAALARVRHAWVGPPRGHEDEWSLAVLADVLPRAGVGPLWQALVYAAPRCQRVGASSHGARLGGEFHLTADLRTGVAPEVAAAEFDALLARVRAGEELTDEVVARTLGRAEAGLIWPLESMAHRAAELARAVATYDDPQWGVRRLAQLRAVTPTTIRDAATRWLDPARRVVVTTRPA